jgi:group II intron reverse transcriptase/maturase
MIFGLETKTQAISREQVWESWKRIKQGGKSAGIDGITISMIEKNPRKYLYPLWNRMASGSYFPPPVREAKIPKGEGKKRSLGIPTVIDRVAQDVIRAELEKIVEPNFHPSSFGYRPGKSQHDAVEQCARNCWERWYVVDIDIKGFFDHIDHELMMRILRKITDKRHILIYCERWLKASIQTEDGKERERLEGSPQGGVISPLLSNIFLHEVFDSWMQHNHSIMVFERYADDIIIHTRSMEQSGFILDKARERFKQYSLELNKDKTKIVYCYRTARFHKEGKDIPVSFDFLGFTFKPRRCSRSDGQRFWGFRPSISKKSQKRILGEIKKLALHKWIDKDIHFLANALAPKIRGWINYYGKFRISEMQALFRLLNKRLARWFRNKYRLKTYGHSYGLMKRIIASYPNTFVHWEYGFRS